MQFAFIVWQVEGYRDHLLSPHIKLSKKIKTGLELVSLHHFPHIF